MHLVGFTTESAVVRQMLEQVGEQTTAPAIATASSLLLAANGLQLAALEAVFEEVCELEFDEKANLVRKRVTVSGFGEAWVWFRRWQGALRVVECRVCSMVIGQYLLARRVDPFPILS